MVEEKRLICPICQGAKAKIVGSDIKLGGKVENKEFQACSLTVLKCIRCGYFMFFDSMAEFATKEF